MAYCRQQLVDNNFSFLSAFASQRFYIPRQLVMSCEHKRLGKS